MKIKNIINSIIISLAFLLYLLFPIMLITNINDKHNNTELKQNAKLEEKNSGIKGLNEVDLFVKYGEESVDLSLDDPVYWFNGNNNTFGKDLDTKVSVNYFNLGNGIAKFKFTLDIDGITDDSAYYGTYFVPIPEPIYKKGHDSIIKFINSSSYSGIGYDQDRYFYGKIDGSKEAHFAIIPNVYSYDSWSSHANPYVILNPIIVNLTWDESSTNVKEDISNKYDLWAKVDGFNSEIYLKTKKNYKKVFKPLDQINSESKWSSTKLQWSSTFNHHLKINNKEYDNLILQYSDNYQYYYGLTWINAISRIEIIGNISISDEFVRNYLENSHFNKVIKFRLLVPLSLMNNYKIVEYHIINGGLTSTDLNKIDQYWSEISSTLFTYFNKELNSSKLPDSDDNYFQNFTYNPETKSYMDTYNLKVNSYLPVIINDEIYFSVPLKVDFYNYSKNSNPKLLNTFAAVRTFLGETGFNNLIKNLEIESVFSTNYYFSSSIDIGDYSGNSFYSNIPIYLDLDADGKNKNGFLASSEIWLIVITIISVIGLLVLILLLIKSSLKEEHGVEIIEGDDK